MTNPTNKKPVPIQEWEKGFREAWDNTIEPILDEQFPKDNLGVEHERPSFSRRGAALVLYAQAYIFAEKFIRSLLASQRAKAVRETTAKELKEFLRTFYLEIIESMEKEVEGMSRHRKLLTGICKECKRPLGCIRCQDKAHRQALSTLHTHLREMKKGLG